MELLFFFNLFLAIFVALCLTNAPVGANGSDDEEEAGHARPAWFPAELKPTYRYVKRFGTIGLFLKHYCTQDLPFDRQVFGQILRDAEACGRVRVSCAVRSCMERADEIRAELRVLHA